MSKFSVNNLIDLIEEEDNVTSLTKSDLKRRAGPDTSKLNETQRDQLEKKAAYRIAAKDISKWQESVNHNRTLPTLNLTNPTPNPLSLDLITKNSEPTELEQAISHTLGQEPEPLFTASEPTKAKSKSDAFFKYLKQKRIARIKSKLYHKIKKKQKLRQQPATPEEIIEREEIARIEERVGLRHSKFSKFKKSLLRYAKREHESVSEALNRTAELKQRILTTSRVNSEGKVTFESSSDDEGFLAEQLALHLKDEASKGLFGMKFMQNALKRDREQPTDDIEYTSKFAFDGELVKNTRKKAKKNNEEQQEYINRAFELDESAQVAAEEWEKEQLEQREKEPKFKRGWGSWTGQNIRHPRMAPKPLKYITEKTIINTERDKRAAKYQVSKLPFPYRTAAQYDSVHRIPIGKEWNSEQVYQEHITPEVVTTPGQIINPIPLDNED